MKLKEIMHMLEELCPRSFAMSWDNAGLQVGYSDKEVHTIALALDCTSEVIAKAAAHKADLILTHHPLLFGGIKNITDSDYVGRRILELIRNRKAIILLNKSDLAPVVSEQQLIEETGFPVLSISARYHDGLDELEDLIEKLFFDGRISFNDEVYITNIRHKAALEEAREALGFAVQSIDDGMPEDFWSIDLVGAADALGRITGESAGEDLVNEIFASFCMGK